MFNPTAGRQTILEMFRVTKVGGAVFINPLSYARPIIDFFEHLKNQGLISYEVVRPESFPDPEYATRNRLVMTNQYGYIRAIRLK